VSKPSAPNTLPSKERRRTTLAARGEPMIWLLGAGQVVASLMILGLLLFVLIKGFATFWPKPIELVETTSGARMLGEITRTESFRPVQSEATAQAAEMVDRRLVRTGNYDLYGDDFRWVLDSEIVSSTRPADAVAIERLEWGTFVGFIEEYQVAGQSVGSGREAAWQAFQKRHDGVRDLWREIGDLERHELGDVFEEINALRLSLRRLELEHGKHSAEYAAATAEADRARAELTTKSQEIGGRVAKLREQMEQDVLVLSEIGGVRKELPVYAVVRAYQANQLSLPQRLGIYFSRWWEFMSDEPRESNTEGGVFPAIFGTVLMTLIMALAVTPFGVIAALYLREYAKQGMIVSAVRIAVNNLAGVPSIVFGVFGLGFFCYLVGGTIDSLFYPEYAPSPKFGTQGLIWASLTLALLTLPVVIVATEEALSAVPRSLREAGYACGASKWQVIRMVVLPKAMPGIMTGIILAMARGAGEVAPLMLTGVVKLAPELPVSGDFPFIHFERSIMHLGFHIYDLGFQSRNAEAAKPMVFTTTLLLICVIVLMNVFVISLRTRLKRKLTSGYF
jgi:phosphate transport system permease protein